MGLISDIMKDGGEWLDKKALADEGLPLGIVSVDFNESGTFGAEWSIEVVPWYEGTGEDLIPGGQGTITMVCQTVRDRVMRAIQSQLDSLGEGELFGPVAMGQLRTKRGAKPAFVFLDYDEKAGKPIMPEVPQPEPEPARARTRHPQAQEARRGRPPGSKNKPREQQTVRQAEIPETAPQASADAVVPPDEAERRRTGQSTGQAQETVLVKRMIGFAVCQACLEAGVVGSDPDQTPGMISGRAFPDQESEGGYRVIHQCSQAGTAKSLVATEVVEQ